MHPGANHAAEGDAGPYSRSSTRRRNPMACLLCRKRKIKCEFNNGPDVCDHCRSKNTKCTVLSVAQEEALKAWGCTDESLASMSSAEVESLQRRLPSSAEHTETHLATRQHHGLLSTHHPLPSTGQERSENPFHTYDGANLPYNHHTQTARRTGSTNPVTVPINTPHPQVHAHHPSSVYTNYPSYASPSPNHQMPYQIPAAGSASVQHHAMGDHHEVQQLHPNIPAHSNAVQSQDHANYSGQTTYPFQTAQQPSQGQITQYQCGVYPTTMHGYTHDGSQWRR